jgi:hypothetical protein
MDRLSEVIRVSELHAANFDDCGEPRPDTGRKDGRLLGRLGTPWLD